VLTISTTHSDVVSANVPVSVPKVARVRRTARHFADELPRRRVRQRADGL
jgi:SnoaL-like domain